LTSEQRPSTTCQQRPLSWVPWGGLCTVYTCLTVYRSHPGCVCMLNSIINAFQFQNILKPFFSWNVATRNKLEKIKWCQFNTKQMCFHFPDRFFSFLSTVEQEKPNRHHISNIIDIANTVARPKMIRSPNLAIIIFNRCQIFINE